VAEVTEKYLRPFMNRVLHPTATAHSK
jgi:hypothetical protein